MNIEKKRKIDIQDGNEKMSALVEAARELLGNLTIHVSLNAWAQSLKEEERAGYGILYATFSGDGYSLNPHIVHPSLEHFTVMRDERGSVTSISDTKTRLVGKSLAKVMSASYALLNGFKEVIFEDLGLIIQVTLFPTGLVVLDAPSKKKEHHRVALEVHTFKAKQNVFFTTEDLKALASLDFMSVTSLKEVLRTYNGVVEREAFILDTESISDVGPLLESLDASNKRSLSDFYGQLLAAVVEERDIKEKVDAFAHKPSATLARTLNLRKPYTAPLVTQGSLDRVQKVKLASLKDDADVLLSTSAIDDKFYQSLSGNASAFEVYPADSMYGIKKGNKFHALQNTETCKAIDLKRMLNAIANSNRVVGPRGPAAMEVDALEGLADADL